MERGCDGSRLAERLDAAAGAVVQLRVAEGTASFENGQAPAQLLELGRDDLQWQERLFPVHASDQPPLWLARRAEDAPCGKRVRCRLSPPPATRRSKIL